MDSLPLERLQLASCVKWIQENHFKRVVIQLKKELLVHSFHISNYIKAQCSAGNQLVDIYITQSNTCSVDLLVTQHVSNLDAIIYFGNVCLTQPEICCTTSTVPILFVFGSEKLESSFDSKLNSILGAVRELLQSQSNLKLCIFYDTSLIDYAIELETKLGQLELNSSVIDVVDLYCPNPSWSTTLEHQGKVRKLIESNAHRHGHYLLKNPIEFYNCSVLLGTRPSLKLILDGPPKVLRIDCYDSTTPQEISVTRLLNRRMALVNRVKDEEDLKIGVIITNPLPDFAESSKRLKYYASLRKHTLYFISMIQTIDECKIGNFDLCDAFIVINSCTCSTILETLVFNRPILTDYEFKLACGIETEYGRVLWPGSSSTLTDDDKINKRKVSDVSLALVHTRNELLERCSQARLNRWSGMDFKAPNVGSDGLTETMDSLVIEKGLEGVASSYLSEPLGRSQQKESLLTATSDGNKFKPEV